RRGHHHRRGEVGGAGMAFLVRMSLTGEPFMISRPLFRLGMLSLALCIVSLWIFRPLNGPVRDLTDGASGFLCGVALACMLVDLYRGAGGSACRGSGGC